MPELPRLAIGTIQEQASSQFMTWALLGLLGQNRKQVQRFVGRACSPYCGDTETVAGNAPRHLDSWVMSEDVTRELFHRAAKRADISVVDGRYSQGDSSANNLGTLAQRLDLPRLVVIDVAKLDGCQIPQRLEGAAGLLLDGVTDESHFCQIQTNLEALWGVPVIGALERLDGLRSEIQRQPPGVPTSPNAIAQLTRSLQRYTSAKRLHEVAARPWSFEVAPHVFCRKRDLPQVTVAVAYDDAFAGYFPETLEVLEHLGARVIDFSPLRDEVLPEGVDLVYFGCGHVEQFATDLSDNMCMALSLRNHLCAGRRIFAEGSGVAYLCQHVELDSDTTLPMVGILPCVAHHQRHHAAPVPVEVTLNRDCWLAPNASTIRGYRSSRWRLQPSSEFGGLSITKGADADILAQGPLVACGFNLHLASQVSILQHFFRPRLVETVRGSAGAIVW